MSSKLRAVLRETAFQFPPIIERELRLASRRPGNYWGRAAGAGIAMIFGFAILSGEHALGRSPMAGQTAFGVLGAIAGLLVVTSVLQLSSEAFVREKREDTLGLLFLTPLKPLELVLGKLLSTSLPAFYRFVALIPILGLPMLMGGVSLRDFLLLVAGLLGVVVLGAAVGLFCSALSWEEKAAGSLATLGLMAVVGGPLLLYGLMAWSRWPGAHWLLVPMPIYPMWHALLHRPIPSTGLLLWAASTCLMTWFLIRLTCRVLPRCWMQRPATLPRTGESAVTVSVPALKTPAAIGLSGSRRFKISRRFSPMQRAELLDRNPILWLSLSSQASLASIWVAVGATYVSVPLIALLLSMKPGVLIEPGLALVVCFVSNAALKLCVATVASAALLREHPRESLELLLSTPLAARELVEGHATAIRQTVQPRVIRLLCIEVAWLGTTIGIKAMKDGGEALLYLLPALAVVGFLIPDLYAAGWSSLWQGAKARNAREAEQEGMRVLVVPWIGIFIFSTAVLPFFGNFRGETSIVVLWMVFSYLSNRWHTKRARMHLANDLELWARRRAAGEMEHYTFWARLGRWFGRLLRETRAGK